MYTKIRGYRWMTLGMALLRPQPSIPSVPILDQEDGTVPSYPRTNSATPFRSILSSSRMDGTVEFTVHFRL